MTTDATQITSSLLIAGAARAGDVLAERYELLEAVDTDGASVGFRALDQETERAVLVRIVAGPGLREQVLGQVLHALRTAVGVGGRFLSTLLDADREEQHPFTVEAWPAGAPLTTVLEQRRGQGPPLPAREVLPLVAQVDAALGAIGAPWHHGDVRAAQVWLHEGRVCLTGAFLLSALPPTLLAERVEALGPGASNYAPEVRAGRAGSASDRFGLAALAWEALTGQGAERTERPRALSPPLFDALQRLLDPDPARRPNDCAALIAALAAEAGLEIPRLDPEPRRASSAPPPARRARIEGAAAEGTQEISFDQILEEHTVLRGAPAVELRSDELVVEEQDEDALDPDLVQAALNAAAPPSPGTREAGDDLDPRLVRAALGVNGGDLPIEEVPIEEVEDLDPRLVRAALSASRSAPGPRPELGVPPPLSPPRFTGSDPPPPPPARRAATGADGSTAVIRRPPEPSAARRASPTGPLVVLGALLLGVAIVASAFLIRSWMTEAQDSQKRSRQIQERLQELRRAEP